MKIFAYGVRPYDELAYFEKFSREYGFEFDGTPDYPSMENAELARGYDAISIITNVMTEELLDKFKEMGIRYIATRSIGFEHMDAPYMKKIGLRGIHVSYSPNAVANYTIMMMLMACRKIDYIMEKASLQDYTLKGKVGKELSLSTVGVIGTGRIGETVIKHLSGFGCRILAYDVYPKDSLKGMAEYVDLDTLYAESDIITLHVPGMESNHHMIDAAAITKMKDDVILINAARGMLVDNEALLEGIESGKIGYAALDTFDHEQGLYYLSFEEKVIANRDLALLSANPRVMLSPHMAFYTEQSVSDMVKNAVLGIMELEEKGESSFEITYEL